MWWECRVVTHRAAPATPKLAMAAKVWVTNGVVGWILPEVLQKDAELGFGDKVMSQSGFGVFVHVLGERKGCTKQVVEWR